jgi:hypothetical protein
MKLEQQVCSLELAKKLKELGIDDYNSLFHWRYGGKSKPELQRFNRSHTGHELTNNDDVTFEWCSAFTVAELGEMLPQYFSNTKVEPFLFEGYIQDIGNKEEFSGDTEANCRANMLIYLLENNLLTPPTKP